MCKSFRSASWGCAYEISGSPTELSGIVKIQFLGEERLLEPAYSLNKSIVEKLHRCRSKVRS